jgi:hypothetical protein
METETLFEDYLVELTKLGNESDSFQTQEKFLDLFKKLITNNNPFGDRRKEELKKQLLKMIIVSEIGEDEANNPYDQVECVFNSLNEDFGFTLKELQYYDDHRLVSVDFLTRLEGN